MGTLILLAALVFVLVALVSTTIVNMLIFFKVSSCVNSKNTPAENNVKEKTVEVELEDL